MITRLDKKRGIFDAQMRPVPPGGIGLNSGKHLVGEGLNPLYIAAVRVKNDLGAGPSAPCAALNVVQSRRAAWVSGRRPRNFD